jgi:hypothetical protein
MDALIKNGGIVLAREKVAKWVREIDQSFVGSTALESVALHMARSSPSDAADWLRALPISEERNFAVGTLASDWATRDPHGAMEWAVTLNTDEGRIEAMQRAFSQWVEQDPVRAAEWLDRDLVSLSIGPQLDQMLTSLIAASPMARTDGEGALQWARLVGEPRLRSQVIGGVFSTWLRSDRPTAARYLRENAELTSEQKSGILKSHWKARAEGDNE